MMALATGTKLDRTALGILIILASVLTMAFADAVVKLVSDDINLWQVFVTRSLFAIPILLVLLLATGVGLRPRSLRWTALRSLPLLGTWLLLYASLPVLSLSVAAVVVYTNPIMIAGLIATACWR